MHTRVNVTQMLANMSSKTLKCLKPHLQVTDGEHKVRLAEHADTRERPALYPEEERHDSVRVLMEPAQQL